MHASRHPRLMLAATLGAAILLSAAMGQADENHPQVQVLRLSDRPYVRYVVTLPAALPDDTDLTLHLGHQGDVFRQVWATVGATGQIADEVDAGGLRVQSGRLRGTVRVATQLSADSPTYAGAYELDLSTDGGGIQGRYRGSYAVRTDNPIYSTAERVVTLDQVRLLEYGDSIRGQVTGEAFAPAVGPGPARFELRGAHLLQGDASWTRYATIHLDVEGEQVGNVRVVPSRDNVRWRAEVREAQFRFEGDRLTGSLAIRVTQGGAGTRDGLYSMRLDARVEDNQVTGQYLDIRHDDSPTGGATLVGRAAGLGDADGARIYILSMPEAIENKDELRVHLRYEDGAFLRGSATRPGLAHHFAVDPSRIRLRGDRIVGELPVTFPRNTISAGQDYTVVYALDARRGDDGTVGGEWACSFGQRYEVGEVVGGEVLRADAIRQRHALRPGYDWPMWNGPDGNFTARPGGHQVVDRLEQSRLVWKSEPIPPGRCQTTRYGEGNIVRYLTRGGAASGGSSPVVADGLVYIYYFRPAPGPVIGEVERWSADGQRVLRDMWSTVAEDVVLAMDAATGETVFQTRVAGGRYHSFGGTGTAKGAYTANPAVGGGRLYVHATGNRTLCLDARTGEVQWMSPQGGRHVLALDDQAVFSGEHLTALDASSGQVRWQVRNAGDPAAAPLLWEHEGRRYVISGNRSGRVVCVDAGSGEIAWEFQSGGNNARTMSIGSDHLLLNVGGLDRTPNRLGAYRLTPQGATLAWQMPDGFEYSAHHGKVPVIVARRVYLYSGQGQQVAHALLVLDLPSGRVLDRQPLRAGSGHVQWFEDRLIMQLDASHSNTPLNYYRADGGRLQQLGTTWRPPHRETTSYYPFLTSHAIADGRIFIRGATGIYCYDLRRE